MINYRGLNIPFVSFGAVTSDDLFCDNEQVIFDFYEKNGDRYRRALDIGANIGVHSILMARQGWDVQAFEPDQQHASAFLWQHRLRNDIPLGYFPKLKTAAVSDHIGKETFVRVKGNTTSSHLKGDKRPYGELEEFEVETVDCRPLFDWADFAKIDCEGHEARILLTVTPAQAEKVDFMVEIGNKKNAELIWPHFKKLPTRLWSQKNDWREVMSFADMPIHHSEGALFIGNNPPFPE
ncbi:MAG: FkbM family methyltransferase [Sulfuricaulis sp.]|nr:FkbM family methyltransferase [Sulfuricaulis sp.]